MKYAILALGLLVTPALADENLSPESAKNKFIIEKATSDIKKHFESKNLKVDFVDLTWNAKSRGSAEIRLTGYAIVARPGRDQQVARCEAFPNREKTNVVVSCHLFTENLRFTKDECEDIKGYFELCKKDEPQAVLPDDGKTVEENARRASGPWKHDLSKLLMSQEEMDAIYNSKYACLPDVHSKYTLSPIIYRHHMVPYTVVTEDKFSQLCFKVCDGTMPAIEATRKFCPRHKL
jgi:hypothetical protein